MAAVTCMHACIRMHQEECVVCQSCNGNERTCAGPFFFLLFFSCFCFFLMRNGIWLVGWLVGWLAGGAFGHIIVQSPFSHSFFFFGLFTSFSPLLFFPFSRFFLDFFTLFLFIHTTPSITYLTYLTVPLISQRVVFPVFSE